MPRLSRLSVLSCIALVCMVFWVLLYRAPFSNLDSTQDASVMEGRRLAVESCSVLEESRKERTKENKKKSDQEKYQGVQSLIRSYIKEHSYQTLFPYEDVAVSRRSLRERFGKLDDRGAEYERRLSAEVEKMKKKKDEELCKSDRKFVVAVYSCPTQIGNRIHEFLNAFAGAIVTNRTLIWKFCDRYSCQQNKQLCDPYLQLHSLHSVAYEHAHSASNQSYFSRKHTSTIPWMADADTVLARLKNGGCTYPTYDNNDNNIPSASTSASAQSQQEPPDRNIDNIGRVNFNDVAQMGVLNSNGVTSAPVVPYALYSTLGEAVVACANIDSGPLQNSRIIDFGALERREMFGLTLPGAQLGTAATQRAHSLFSAGHLASYGLMFRHAFTFQRDVLTWNDRVKRAAGITSAADPKGTVGGARDFILGVHVRHMMKKDEGDKDTRGELLCIQEMLRSHVPRYEQYQHQSSSSEDKDKDKVKDKDKDREVESLRCTVILASDRQPTLDRLQKEIEALGCRVFMTAHTEEERMQLPASPDEDEDEEEESANSAEEKEKEKSGSSGRVGNADVHTTKSGLSLTVDVVEQTKKRYKGYTGDHGPFRDGLLSIADFELLSHADAFIGSADDQSLGAQDKQNPRPSYLSTFSLLIASMVATNTRNHHRVFGGGVASKYSNSKNNVLSDEDTFISYLPRCGSSFSSYRYDKGFKPTLTKVDASTLSDAEKATQGTGNGFYQPTMCSVFSWNKQCENPKVVDASKGAY